MCARARRRPPCSRCAARRACMIPSYGPSLARLPPPRRRLIRLRCRLPPARVGTRLRRQRCDLCQRLPRRLLWDHCRLRGGLPGQGQAESQQQQQHQQEQRVLDSCGRQPPGPPRGAAPPDRQVGKRGRSAARGLQRAPGRRRAQSQKEHGGKASGLKRQPWLFPSVPPGLLQNSAHPPKCTPA
jgi:hypothetical protein